MPRGSMDEKRPADLIASAHKVFQIAIGEDANYIPAGGSRSGLDGAAARAEVHSGADRKAIAKKGFG